MKWNFTQKRSPAAFTHWKVWDPKPSMWRYDAGIPRSPKSQVNWCTASGGVREEVPDVVRLLSVGERIDLLGVDEVLLLYWITHMWLRAHRGQVTDDPIVVALEDPVSYLVGGAIVVAMVLSMT